MQFIFVNQNLNKVDNEKKTDNNQSSKEWSNSPTIPSYSASFLVFKSLFSVFSSPGKLSVQ